MKTKQKLERRLTGYTAPSSSCRKTPQNHKRKVKKGKGERGKEKTEEAENIAAVVRWGRKGRLWIYFAILEEGKESSRDALESNKRVLGVDISTHKEDQKFERKYKRGKKVEKWERRKN